MQIARFPSITETQFFGCVAAFIESLFRELNSAAAALRRLEGTEKGRAFAFEMDLDAHRYGALIVLDRWSAFTAAFAPHLQLARDSEITAHAAARVETAANILNTANRLLDAAAQYGSDVVEACAMAFESLATTFAQERATVERWSKLGPMLPEEYGEARRIFLQDLAAR